MCLGSWHVWNELQYTCQTDVAATVSNVCVSVWSGSTAWGSSPCPSVCFATSGKRPGSFSLWPRRTWRTAEDDELKHSHRSRVYLSWNNFWVTARVGGRERAPTCRYLLRARVDLDGVGDQPSRFLSGHGDDVFKDQRNLQFDTGQGERSRYSRRNTHCHISEGC